MSVAAGETAAVTVAVHGRGRQGRVGSWPRCQTEADPGKGEREEREGLGQVFQSRIRRLHLCISYFYHVSLE